jgi:hypothetical protein
MRGARAPVFVEGDRHFFDAQTEQRRFDDHLAGVFHPTGLEVHRHPCVFGEGTQPTMEVADGASIQRPTEPTQDRVAQPLM